MTGRYPALCHYDWLTPEQRRQAETSEKQQNRRVCLSGRYPSLCKKSLLSQEELRQVVAAEKKVNLQTCLTGLYKSLCNRNLLNAAELKQTIAAERAANLRICMTGIYSTLCDRALLSRKELKDVQAAEKQAVDSRSGVRGDRIQRRRLSSSSCEAGHWIDSVNHDGRIIILEDGSVWEVDAVDTIDSMLWLPTSDIVVCGDKLINTDDKETVSAQQIR
jgi:hypothetical protein